MKLASSNILGMAIGERGLALAEIAAWRGRGRGQLVLTHAATFPYPQGLSLDDPKALPHGTEVIVRAVARKPAKRRRSPRVSPPCRRSSSS